MLESIYPECGTLNIKSTNGLVMCSRCDKFYYPSNTQSSFTEKIKINNSDAETRQDQKKISKNVLAINIPNFKSKIKRSIKEIINNTQKSCI